MLYSDKLVKQKFSRHRLVCLLSLLTGCMRCMGSLPSSCEPERAQRARSATLELPATPPAATPELPPAMPPRCLALSRGSSGGQRRHVRRRKLPGNDEESIIGWRVHNAHVPLLEPGTASDLLPALVPWQWRRPVRRPANTMCSATIACCRQHLCSRKSSAKACRLIRVASCLSLAARRCCCCCCCRLIACAAARAQSAAALPQNKLASLCGLLRRCRLAPAPDPRCLLLAAAAVACSLVLQQELW